MSFYTRGIIILFAVMIFGALFRPIKGHPMTDVGWVGILVMGLGVSAAWLLSDVMATLQEILKELRRKP